MAQGSSDPGFWRMPPGAAPSFLPLRKYLKAPRTGGPQTTVSVTTEDLPTLASIRLNGMRVKLINGPAAAPDYLTTGGAGNKTRVLPPLALINLASFLRTYGAQVTIHDSFVGEDFTDEDKMSLSDVPRLLSALAGHPDDALDHIMERWAALLEPDTCDLIGFSACNEADPLTFVLLQRRLRRGGTSPHLVMGGIWDNGHVRTWLGELDAVVSGDGEVPLLLLCHALRNRRAGETGSTLAWIPGVVSQHEGRFHGRPLEHSMNVRAVPDLTGVDLSLYSYTTYAGLDGPVIPYQMSVGCPYNCAYCNNAERRRYKLRHPSLVMRDLDRLHDRHGIRNLFLLNSAFNSDPRYADAITESLIAAGSPFRWCDCARPRRMDGATFARMRRAGCEWLNWGFDTLSDRLSRMYGRRVVAEQFGRVLDDAAAAGIRNSINLVVGMPHETDADVEALFRFFESYHPSIHWVFFLPYQLVPQSDIGRFPERYGLQPGAGGDGVDEADGLTWPERRALGGEFMGRIKAVLGERYGYG